MVTMRLLPAWATLVAWLAVAVAVVEATGAADDVVRFSRDLSGVPHGWRSRGRADASAVVSVMLALRQAPGTAARLQRELLERSDPTHHMYGRWMTVQEVEHIAVAADGAVAAIRGWLASSFAGRPAAHLTFSSDAVNVTATVATMETHVFPGMLFHDFRRDGARLIAAVGVCRLPLDVHRATRLVAGLSDFPPTSHRRHFGDRVANPASTSSLPPVNNQPVVPQVVWRTYGIQPAMQQPATAGNSQGVMEFTNSGSFNKTSLAAFQHFMQLPRLPVAHVEGRYSLPNGAGIEQTLDVQTMLGVSPNVETWYWTFSNWMYEFARTLASASSAPLVASISFAWYDSQQCTSFLKSTCASGESPQQYMAAVDVEFMKIGLRGISLVAAAGDFGAYGIPQPPNMTLNPYYPASSPWVLAVGATELYNSTHNGPAANLNVTFPPVCNERSLDCGFQHPLVCGPCSNSTSEMPAVWSGGGFSLDAPCPVYQRAAVQHYLKTAAQLPPPSAYNASNRGYPDVTALGSNVYIRIWDSWMSQGGTSAATPMWAGVLSLMNNARLAAGKASLGFVNPLLYHLASTSPGKYLTDMTFGDNIDGAYAQQYGLGFYALPGWDPVSGLGSPVVANLIEAARDM